MLHTEGYLPLDPSQGRACLSRSVCACTPPYIWGLFCFWHKMFAVKHFLVDATYFCHYNKFDNRGLVSMFYRVLQYGDSDSAASFALAETFWYMVIWCLIEGVLGQGLYHFAVTFVSKTSGLFGSLEMSIIGGLFNIITSPVYLFGFLGTGGLWDWMARGFVLWLCTGLPLILYRLYRR